MLRKGLILLVVSLTVSLAVAQQTQEPKNSTDTIFHGPHQQPPQGQQQATRATRQHIGEQDAWGRSVRSIGRNNIPDPLGDYASVSATSLAAPKEAKSALRKALRELDKGHSAKLAKSAQHLDKARQYLEKAVAEYPEYATAWTKLGQVKADTGDPDGAIVALEKSVKLDERYLPPYDALVWLYMDKRDWDHATELAEFVLDINPLVVKMRWYLAGCAYESGRDDEALALFREIQSDAEAAKQFPQTHLFLGLIYARRGQLAKAAADYKLYLTFVPNAQDAEAIKKQLNEWQQLGVI
jgi:tetratricopeptide (TPR) repeat protein